MLRLLVYDRCHESVYQIEELRNGGMTVFNFKDELSRYQPILEIDQIEDALQPNQMQDLLDILQHIAKDKKQTPQD